MPYSPGSPSHNRFHDHSPTKSSPLRHTISTRSNTSDHTADSGLPSRNGTLSSAAGSFYSQTSYESTSDPFVTRMSAKRERSESPVKQSAAFAKWEQREQPGPDSSYSSRERMDVSPKKIKDEDWRSNIGRSDGRSALRPVAGNTCADTPLSRAQTAERTGETTPRFKENVPYLPSNSPRQQSSLGPPQLLQSHTRSQSADSRMSKSPEPQQLPISPPSPTKNSMATLSRSDSMRASTRPRERGHARFGSMDVSIPQLDGDDIAKLQKSSTPHLRHLSKLASESGTEDLNVHSPDEQVVGLVGRRRLQRANSVKPAKSSQSQFASQYASTRWMDTQRKHLQAYEYLCHIGEARAWLQDVLEPSELPPIVQLEEALRDGVTLAEVVVRLATSLPVDQQRALGSLRIFRNPKLQYRHSDNIALFFRFLAEIALPELFRFELVDLYEKKNIPKVIYCIHALSWLLYRKGIVDFRIGNLLGQLQFEEHELEEAQKGIDRSGVAMPNFGGMREAMQVEEEPPPPPEPTPEEILAEQHDVIVDLQSQVRGAIVRLRLGNVMQDLWDVEQEIARFQALARGGFAREIHNFKMDMDRSTRRLQAAAKGFLTRKQHNNRQQAWQASAQSIVLLQSLWRGRQQRAETHHIKAELRVQKNGLKELQAAIRGALGRWRASDTWCQSQEAEPNVIRLQAASRGLLTRLRQARTVGALQGREPAIVQIQSALRSFAARKALEREAVEIRQHSPAVAYLQAQGRGFLLRKQVGATLDLLEHCHDEAVSIQALARGMIQRRRIGTQLGALEDHESTFTSLQACVRAYLERQRIYEQLLDMEKESDSIIQKQAAVRAMLTRGRVGSLLTALEEEEQAVVDLQAACRGFVVRSQFEEKRRHYYENMQKVVKLQSFVRAKQQGESYKSLVNGKNPPLPVVRRHLHLLTDSNLEFESELEAERLRRLVVESVRRNELVEGYVEGLDVKIALLVKNKITLDEVVKHQKHFGGSASQLLRSGTTLHGSAIGLDLKALNKSSRKKLSGYEELFLLLQTHPTYLTGLIAQLTARGSVDKDAKNLERLVLTVFRYAQTSREEYFFLKLLAACTQRSASQCQNVEDFIRIQTGAFGQKLMLSYIRAPKDRAYLKTLLGNMIRDGICAQQHLDLESDPLQIYWAILNNEELSTGRESSRPRDIPREAAIREPDVRPTYVQHLQDLRDLCDGFFLSLEETMHKLPYGFRYIIAEQYQALRERFPREEPSHLAVVAGGYMWKMYLLPALKEPEMWGVIDRGLNPLHKRNLGQVVTVLGQVASGRLFAAENLYLQPLNNWVSESLERWHDCLHRLFDMPSPEEFFSADEFSDLYSRTKPTLYIKLADIFALHSLIADNVHAVAPTRDDPIRELLSDLGTAKSNESDLSSAAQGGEITLMLKSRYTIQEDPNSEARALFTATKRLVLYIIKVQSGSNLMEILTRPISHEDADRWIAVVREEVAEKDREHRRPKRPNSVFDPKASMRGARAQSVYSEAPSAISEDRRDLLDLEAMTYAELKSTALENILALEQPSIPAQFRVSRHNNYQEILNALAADIRQKHRRRLERQREVESTRATLSQLDDKAKFLEDQLRSYNDYIEQCLHTLASKKGQKHKFVMPFTKQWSHERELERAGRQPKFGSYKYSARQLADKGVLISWAGYAPEHWAQLNVVISSDEVGVFHLEASSGSMMVPGANANILLDDLLQAQYDNKNAISVFEDSGSGGGAKLAVNLLLHLVFKKFYRDE